MKTKQFIWYCTLVAMLLGLMFISCSKNELENPTIINQTISKTTENSFLNIPYTDSVTLSKFDNDKEILNYNLARRIAMIEADGVGFVEEMNWEGHSLSKQPVVIYGFDSKPKYYEFFYKNAEGQEVGSVMVMAKKKAATVLQEVRGTVRDYSALYSKAGAGSTFITDWAGNMYMGVVGKSGDTPTAVIDPETGETVEEITELSDEEILDEVVEALKSQEQEFIVDTDSIADESLKKEIEEEATLSLDQQVDSLHKALEIEHAERDAFWEVMEEYADSLLVVTDEELTSDSKFFGRWWRRFRSIFIDKTTYKYELPEYKKDFTNRGGRYIAPGTSDREWCGPWTMDWIYHVRKGGSKYSHFESWASTLGPIGWTCRTLGAKPMFPKEMCISMRKATSSIWINPYYSTGRWNALDHIRHPKTPIVILTTAGRQMHWKVGYGCYRTGNIFWRNYYFACQDNGSLKIPKNNHYHRSSWFITFVKVYD